MVITAGSVDLLVEMVCEDDDQLLDIVSRIRATDGVESTETFMYLGLRKQTYAWGTRPPRAPADRPVAPAQWQRPGLGGTSRAGLRSKKPHGFSENETVSTGMTGQSSGRGMWWMPNVPQHDVGVGDRPVGLRPLR